jgi:cytidylate kinase
MSALRQSPSGACQSAGHGILHGVTDERDSLDTQAPSDGLVVALDGPGSSGKSTVGAEAARRLGYRFCDTGLLYRAVAWLALERGVAATDVAALVPLVAEVRLVADARGRLRHVEAGGRDVTTEVCEASVDRVVSDYARVPELRSALVARQHEIAARGGIIMAGRDIGTTILPDAPVKIYLDASAEERAKRRAVQRKTTDAGEADQILAELRRRDAIDSTRETAPLRAAPDAVVVHTDGYSFEETVGAVVGTIRHAAGLAAKARAGGGEGGR